MSTGNTPAARWPLFERLLSHALDRFGEGSPVAVSLAGDPVLGRLSTGWENERANSLDEASDVIQRHLPCGPVILLAPWERLPPGASAPFGMPFAGMHEVILAGCRPSGAGSVLLAILPADTLTASRTSRLRAAVGQYWQPILVVYGGDVVPGVHRAFEVAAVMLRARSTNPAPVRMFRLPTRMDDDVVEADFLSLLKMSGGRRTYGYVIRTAIPAEDSLAFDRHDPAVLDRRAALAEFGRAVRLGDMFALPRPGVHLADDSALLRDGADAGTVRVLAGRDVRRDGTIAAPDEQTKWAELPPERCLRSGDLLVRSIQAATDAGGLVVAEVTPEELPAAAAHTAIVLRPDPSLTRYQRMFVKQFLRSPLAYTLATDGVGYHVRARPLLELPVPQPDEALTTALVDLTSAAERLDKWRSDAVAVVESAVLDEPKEARARLLDSGRLLRMRADAAGLLDDFGHTIRTRFPHPIAYRWRRVEAEMSGEATSQAYEAVLEAAEVLLSYAANLALVMARHAGLEIAAVRAIREKLASGRSGPSLGDWVAVLTELNAKKFQQLPSHQPLGELRRTLPAGQVDDARIRLSRRRNDLAHLRRGDVAQALVEAHADLTTLMANAEFLCDLRLVHLSSVRWDVLRTTATVRMRELMGDHSIVPARVLEYPSNELEEGSLYVADTTGQLHLLRPFLIGRACPTCTHWSTFHVDLAPRNTPVILKSLEHGHTLADDAVRDPLRQVGLL